MNFQGSSDGLAPAPKVMLVDGDMAGARIIRMLLAENQYSAVHFQTPRKALAEFRRKKKDYHAVIVALHMAEMTGFDFARRVRRFCPEIKIVLLTNFEISKAEFQKVFPSAQIDDIIARPDVGRMLLETIRGPGVSPRPEKTR